MSDVNTPSVAGPAMSPNDPHRLWRTIKALMRTRIVAGLLTVIPLWVTWVVVRFVFETMQSATGWLAKIVADGLVSQTELLPEGVRQYEQTVDRIVSWSVPAISVFMTLIMLYGLGLLTANVFGRRLWARLEQIFEMLPLVKTIYRSTKQVVETLGGSSSPKFKRVVLVEFPRPGMKCIGFLTAIMKDVDTGREMASIFISTTPNPTTGYMQIVPLDEVSDTGWTVEEAIKLLMSGGLLSPPTVAFDRVHPLDVGQLKQPQPEAGEDGRPDVAAAM